MLIHSLVEFLPITEQVLSAARAETIIECGGETGQHANALVKAGYSVTTVDISPPPQSLSKNVHWVQQDSATYLSHHLADAIFLDSDHTYEHVLNELNAIKSHHDYFLIFVHDVTWPCGRRDARYGVDQGEYGVTLDNPNLIKGGFRGCGPFAFAPKEGGPKNGVLTAIEDANLNCDTYIIPVVFGLAILVSHNHPHREHIRQTLQPIVNLVPLFSRLERNRLELYLRVIELQDKKP